ncbi:MAG: glucosaminidase domain-containing protein [Arcobacteraceae bacterium]
MKEQNNNPTNEQTSTIKRFSFSSILVVLAVLLLIFFIVTEQKTFIEKIEREKLIKEEALKEEKYKKELIESMGVSEKKTNFLKSIVPSLDEVYEEEIRYFNDIKTLVKENPDNTILENLREEYKAKDNLELLMALKPHPKSITLAQAAMESAWGESRFFKEANNLFGVWSYNKKEPRIAASSLRGEKTIWLKKYASVKDAIKDYYKMLSRSWAFKEFRALNYEKKNQNPYLLVKKLQKYSEKREVYTKELSSMINYNKFTIFDEVYYERPKTAAPKKEFLLEQDIYVQDDTPKIIQTQELEIENQENLKNINNLEITEKKEEN